MSLRKNFNLTDLVGEVVDTKNGYWIIDDFRVRKTKPKEPRLLSLHVQCFEEVITEVQGDDGPVITTDYIKIEEKSVWKKRINIDSINEELADTVSTAAYDIVKAVVTALANAEDA